MSSRFEENEVSTDILGKPFTQRTITGCVVNAVELGHAVARLGAFDVWTADQPSGDLFGHYRVGDDEELKRLGEAETAVKDKLFEVVKEKADSLHFCLGKTDRERLEKRVKDLQEAMQRDSHRDVQILAARLLSDFI